MIEQLTGHHIPKEYHSIVTVIVFILAYQGIELLYKRLFPHKVPENTTKEKNALVASAGVQLHITTDALKACLEKTTPIEAAALARAARDFLLPAKREAGAKVTSDGGLEISRNTIDELPDDIAMLETTRPSISIGDTSMVVTSHEIKKISILIYPQDGLYIAQCLEHDIVCQGKTPSELKKRMMESVIANYIIAKENGKSLDDIKPAPSKFWAMFNESQEEFKPAYTPIRGWEINPIIRLADKELCA